MEAESTASVREESSTASGAAALASSSSSRTREDGGGVRLEQHIGSELNCPICLDRFVDPIIVPCGHSVCKACLRRLRDTTTTNCPVCRSSLIAPRSTRTFPTNVALKAVVEAYNTKGKEVFYSDSQVKCDTGDCKRNAQQTASLEDFFCCSDCSHMVLCGTCAFKNHRTHTVDPFQNIVGRQALSIQSKSQPMATDLQHLASLHEGVKATIDCLSNFESEITCLLKRFVEGRKEEMTGFERRLAEMQNKFGSTNSDIAKLSSMVTFVDDSEMSNAGQRGGNEGGGEGDSVSSTTNTSTPPQQRMEIGGVSMSNFGGAQPPLLGPAKAASEKFDALAMEVITERSGINEMAEKITEALQFFTTTFDFIQSAYGGSLAPAASQPGTTSATQDASRSRRRSNHDAPGSSSGALSATRSSTTQPVSVDRPGSDDGEGEHCCEGLNVGERRHESDGVGQGWSRSAGPPEEDFGFVFDFGRQGDQRRASVRSRYSGRFRYPDFFQDTTREDDDIAMPWGDDPGYNWYRTRPRPVSTSWRSTSTGGIGAHFPPPVNSQENGRAGGTGSSRRPNTPPGIIGFPPPDQDMLEARAQFDPVPIEIDDRPLTHDHSYARVRDGLLQDVLFGSPSTSPPSPRNSTSADPEMIAFGEPASSSVSQLRGNDRSDGQGSVSGRGRTSDRSRVTRTRWEGNGEFDFGAAP